MTASHEFHEAGHAHRGPNHELHEPHESDGVVSIVALPDEPMEDQRRLPEVGQEGDGKPASFEVMKDLRGLDGPDACLSLRFHEHFPTADEVSPVDRLKGASEESNGYCGLALMRNTPVNQSHFNGLLVGFFEITGPKIGMDLEQCTNDSIGQGRTRFFEQHGTWDPVGGYEEHRTTVGFVKFVVQRDRSIEQGPTVGFVQFVKFVVHAEGA